MIKKLLIFSILLALTLTSYGQEGCDPNVDNTCEVCDNGIDDNGDGKIDSLDPLCAAFYGLEFIGPDTDCSVTPPSSSDPFNISEDPAVSGQNTVDTQSKMAIGDVDGDGIPDVVATSKQNRTIRVIATSDDQDDGSDAGDVKASWKTTDPSVGISLGSDFYFDLETLIADIDGDGTAELFATLYQRKNFNQPIQTYVLARYDFVPGSTQLLMTWGVDLGTNRPGIPGIADFDGDGLGEIYLKNRIYAAESGALLADAGGDWNTEVNAAPVAVNILTGTANLELVSGNIIYSVPNMSSRSLVALTVASDMNALGLDQYFPKVLNDLFEYGITNFSSTSVADFDDDGSLDVFLSGAIGSTNGHTAVFYWNVANGTVGTFLPTHPDTGSGVNTVSYPNGWPWGTGRVNLGELDGDGLLEANFITGNQLYALEESGAGQLVELWAGARTINDSRSGVVATTVYDFDNDGQYELVYRDALVLSIIDGATGLTTNWSAPCQSHTMTEGPIIADVNGDGATDICVPCFTGPGLFKPDGDQNNSKLGGIRLFFSDENAWLPTRKVWNQPGYFVTNINDDLTLPFPQLDQAMVFGNDPCSNGVPGPQTPLNSFLNQVPTINADGCPVYPGPDMEFVGNDPNLNPGDPGYVDPSDPNYFPAVEVIPPICGDLAIVVNFNIINSGLRAITDDIPVSFWDGDPSLDPQPATPAQWLHSETLPIANFGVGDTLSFNGYTFNSTGRAFDLYIVLNDASITAPLTIGGAVEECEIGNNIYRFPIVPRPFTVEIEIIQDNLKCEDTAPDNGELRAVVMENGLEVADYSLYGFQWYAGADTLSPVVPNPKGNSDRLVGMVEGDYTVVVTNLDKGCMSLPIDTTIVRVGDDPVLTILELSPQTQCSPLNGQLEVQVQGGNLGYTFAWFDNLLTPLGVTSAVISNLAAGEYIVAASKDGCTKTESFTLGGPIFPDAVPITTANVLDCSDPNSGAVSASVQINGLPVADDSNYDFIWYTFDTGTNTTGSQLSSVFGTGKNRTGLPVGWYAVIVRDKTSNCESFPPVPTEVVNQTQIPTLVITELLPNTSCDPTDPNGQLRVDIQLGGIPQDPALYTVEWFRGDNTLAPALTTASTNGEIVSGVGSPGVPYTAQVTSAFNCSASDKLILTQNVQVPVITATATDNTICDPLLAASGNYDGAVAAAVTFAGNPVIDFTAFTFTWHDGPLISDPIIAGATGSTISNQPAGFYTATVSLDSVSCVSTPITVEIKTVPDNPVIIITETPETTCSGTPNGSLAAAVDVGGTPTIAGYTYEWFVGLDTSPTGTLVGSTSGTENETAIELDGNATYSVKVINDGTGCSTVLPYNLTDVSKVPSVTLVKTDNIVCDASLGFSGTVTATLTDDNGNPANLANYSFAWYQGVDETGTPVIDSNLATPLTLDGVEGNFYALVATNLTLGCSSVPVNIEVQDLPPPIDIVITENIASINCDPLLARGILAAGVDPGTGAITAGYTFTWYKGPDTSGTPTDIDGINEFRAVNLQGGLGEDYTVHVRDNASGCDNTLTLSLGGFPFTPTISFSVIPNISCVSGSYTGQITTSMTWDDDNNPGTAEVPIDLTNPTPFNFTYAWTGPSGPIALDTYQLGDGSAPNPFLQDGVYNLTITENTTGCSFTPPANTVIADQGDLIVTTTPTPSSNCDPSLANGKILVTVGYDTDRDGIVDDADPNNFTLEYYDGTGTSGIDLTASNGSVDDNGDGFDDLLDVQGGANTYTIVAEYGATGCTIELPIGLAAFPFTPTISFVSVPNSGCTTPNFTGQITTAMTWDDDSNPGTPEVAIPLAGPAPFNFTYAWTGPSGALGHTGYQLGDGSAPNPFLVNGVYNVVITDSYTGCTFSPPAITIDNDIVPIPIDFTINTTNTSCAAGIGELTAGIDLTLTGVYDDNIANLGDYTFLWFKGGIPISNDPSGVGGINANNAIELEGNDAYTVLVTNTLTGCVNTYTEFVQKIITLPQITVTVNDYADNIDCDDALITLTGNITNIASFTPNAATDFIYTWYAGADDTGPQLVSGNTFNVLSTLDGNAYDGTNGIPVGDYTLKVQHINSSCESDIAFDKVDEPPILFDITPTLVAEATTCDVSNGQLFVSVSNNGSGYGNPNLPVYEWFVGAPTNTVPTRYYAWDNNFGGPGIGGYQVIDNVPTASYYSNPQVAFSGMTPVESGPGGIGAPDGITAELDGVESGVYTVVVTTDGGAGCKEYITVEMPIVGNQQNNVVTIDHDTRCDIDNGVINVTLTPDLGFMASNYDVYLIASANPTLNTGNVPATFLDVLPGVNGGPTVFPPAAAGYTLTPGQPYTIASIQNTYTGTECWSVPTSAVVEEWAHPPSFTVESIIPNTSCDPVTTPSGTLNITISHNPSELPAPPPTLYRIEAVDPGGTYPTVTVGSFPGSPLATGIHSIAGLGPADYDITVFSDRGCETMRSITIPNQEIRPSVATATSINPFNCAPLNGEARITLIEYTPVGSAIPVNVTAAGIAPNNFDSYDFIWYLDNGDNIFDPGTDTPIITDALSGANGAVLDVNDPGYIGAGVYWVTATNNNVLLDGVDCSSPGFQFILIDNSIQPTFSTAFSANTSCDPLNVDGSIYIDPDRTGVVTPFTSWTLSFTSLPALYDVNVGGTIPTPVSLTAPTPDVATEGGVYLIPGILDGTYEYTITDNASGCTVDGQLNVIFQQLNPSLSSLTPMAQYSCNADGSIIITEINTITPGSIDLAGTVIPPVNSTDLDMSNYTFTWYRSDDVNNLGPVIHTGAGTAASPGGNFLNIVTYPSIGTGKYWVEFQKTAGTGGLSCDMAPFSIIIDDQSVEPAFAASTTSNTTCDPLASDGVIFIDPDRNGGVPPNFPLFTTWTLDFTAWPSQYDTNPDGTPNPGGTVPVPAGLSVPTPDVVGENGVFLIPGVLDGSYEFTLTDDANGCNTNGQLNIQYLQIPPTVANFIAIPQFACVADGSMQILEITTAIPGNIDIAGLVTPATTIADGDMSNYTFLWYRSNDINNLGPVIHSGVGGNDPLVDGNYLNTTLYPLIGSDRYWVEFEKVGGSGGLSCTSTPFPIDLGNQSIDPTFSVSTVSNTACDLTSPSGGFTIDPDRNGAVPPDFPVFTNWALAFTAWPANFDTNPDGSPNPGGTTPTPPELLVPTVDVPGEAGVFNAANLLPGRYDFTLIDNANGCDITGVLIIPDQPSVPTLTLDNATVVNQTICNPSGSITVNDADISLFDPNTGLPVPGLTTADFDYLWYRDDPTTLPLQDDLGDDIIIPTLSIGTGTGLAGEYSNMGAGTYFVQLVPNGALAGLGAGCYGPPVSKVVIDVSTNPILSFATVVNSSCDVNMPNGTITGTAVEVSGPTADPYTFSWTVDGGALPGGVVQTDLGNVSALTNAPDGTYVMTSTNGNTGCSFSQSHVLILDQSISEPNIISVSTIDPLDCNPTGSITVTDVQVGGFPALVADFEFDWYVDDPIPANQLRFDVGNNVVTTDPAFPPITAATLSLILPGSYFVIARELNTACESIAKEVEILADDIILPAVVVVEDRPQTSCDPLTPNGQLSATADGQDSSNPDYLFSWYTGPFVDPANFVPNGNSSSLPGADAGEYTVEARNLITGCSSTGYYVVNDATDEYKLQVSVATIPVTLCNRDDGVIEARVINYPDLGNFQFQWFDASGISIGFGSMLVDVSIGTYTVVATDLTGTYCPSIITTGVVEDQRTPPPITINEDNPLINCDPSRPNGQLKADVNGKVGGYTFEWYTGTDTTASSIHTGNILSGLTLGDYSVVVTDNLTQCKNLATGSITDGRLLPPSPTITLLSNVTDCLIPDGALTADVGGDILNYTFDWYDGSTVGNNPDNTGFDYFDLDVGDYTVTAIDIRTGCISLGVTGTISDERVYPEFDYIIKPANCETSNGFIEMQFAEGFDVKDVIWYDGATGSEIDRATNLYDYEAGDYEVTVITQKGCEADGQATIPTEITSYNGISANGDNRNDDFEIDCITLFPNNNVKIFNRAGIKVYDRDNYDNDNIVFRGVGEMGVYLAGEDLPDGTYFYIIDKGDGSRPKTGYLELIR